MADPEVFAQIEEFALSYTTAERDEFRFQWNGQDSDQFEDENEEIRQWIAEWIVANPERAPLDLIRDVLREDAQWAQQAWRVPAHAGELIAILQARGGAVYADEFEVLLDKR